LTALSRKAKEELKARIEAVITQRGRQSRQRQQRGEAKGPENIKIYIMIKLKFY